MGTRSRKRSTTPDPEPRERGGGPNNSESTAFPARMGDYTDEARVRLWLPPNPAALMLDFTLRALFVVLFMIVSPVAYRRCSCCLTLRTRRPCASGMPGSGQH